MEDSKSNISTQHYRRQLYSVKHGEDLFEFRTETTTSATNDIGYNHIGHTQDYIGHTRNPYLPHCRYRYRPHHICHTIWLLNYNEDKKCGRMPNVMATLPNIGSALCSTPQFGWRPLLECRAVTLPRRETRWNYLGCPKLTKRSQPLVAEVHHIVQTCRGDIAA